MSTDYKIAAVIVAGGAGSRFGTEQSGTPKQFQPLNKYPLYIWSISKVYTFGLFTDIVITMPPAFIERAQKEIAEFVTGASLYTEPNTEPNRKPNIDVIAGGASRQESVYNALQYLKQKARSQFVVIHDAARPFLTDKMLSDAVGTVTTRGACTIGTPVSDTLKKVELTNGGPGLIIETVDRQNLFAVQTPQAAPLELLLACHEQARDAGIGVTDDAAILETFGHKVVIFPGQNHNIKITVAEDMRAGELLAPLFLPPTPR